MIRISQNLAIIAITALIIGVVSFFTVYLHQTSEREVLSQFEQHQLVHVQHVANKIESYFLAQVLALRAISSAPSFQYGDRAERAGDIRAHFQQLRNSRVSAIFICDPTGTVTHSTDKKMIGVKYGQQEIFLRAKKKENKKKGVVYPSPKPAKSENSNRADFGFLLMIPVYQEAYVAQGPTPSGKFIGTISLVIDFGKYLGDRLNDVDPDPDLDQLWIMDESGTLLFHSAHPEMVLRNIHRRETKCNECHISFEHVEKILKERQGTVKYQLRNSSAELAAFATVRFENLSWIVVMNSSYGKLAAFARRSLWGHMGLLAIVVFAFAVGLTVIRRNDRRKLKAEEEAKHWREKTAEQAKAQEALRRSEEKYRILVETMAEGLAVINENALFTFVNDRFCQMLGYSQEEIIGRPVKDFLEEKNQKMLDEQMERRREGGHEGLEVHWTRKGGGKIITLVSPQMLIGEEERVQGTLAVITDVTKRKQYEEALLESERRLGSLPAQLMTAQENERKRISRELHDQLGQDLNALKMRMGFIKRNLEKSQWDLREECETTLKYIAEIIENARRISRDLSPSILEDFGLEAGLRWLTGHFSSNYGIPVSLDLGKLNLSFSDEAQILIYRVIQEALNNVGKHARATEVWISAVESDGILSFRVRDNGRGFDQKQVFQANPEERGLGLVAMRERARMLGGSFEIRSQEGQGTSIILSVPFPEGGR